MDKINKMKPKDVKETKRTGEVAELQKTLIRLSGQRGPAANTEKRESFRKACPGRMLWQSIKFTFLAFLVHPVHQFSAPVATRPFASVPSSNVHQFSVDAFPKPPYSKSARPLDSISFPEYSVLCGAFPQVINGMTIGIDMSSLFTQMILACSNDDLVLKKMLYQYIRGYASHHPDNVLLTVNTLTKDCQDMDPKLRGLALRTLCSLRLANLLEYLINPLKTGLEDVDPYVRRTAVMGVFKV